MDLKDGQLTNEELSKAVDDYIADENKYSYTYDRFVADTAARKMAWTIMSYLAQWTTEGEHRDCDFRLADLLTDSNIQPWGTVSDEINND
jgi:hypothetical protein